MSTVYFALDIAPDSLSSSLSQLFKHTRGFRYVTCHGLLGSYDDCVRQLNFDNTFSSENILFLWFGNSITNLPWQTAVDLVERLLCLKNVGGTKLLLSVDGCRDKKLIEDAYDLPGGQSRSFMRNGLLHANDLLGDEVFDCNDWDFEGCWDPISAVHNSYHVAKRDLTLIVSGQEIPVAKGEKLHSIASGKWDRAIIERLCEEANVTLKRQWTKPVENFSESSLVYILQYLHNFLFEYGLSLKLGCYLLSGRS